MPSRGFTRGRLPSSPVLAYPDARSPSLTATSLLLVEDDEFVRLALTRALNRTGVFAVTPAENGERAARRSP